MEIRISGKKIVWGIVIVVVLVAAGVWGWTEMAQSNSPTGPSPYSAVYLSSGDVYFGKLSWFPEPHMTDVWYLNRTVNQSGQSQIAVAPLKSVFWGPVDEINLNPKQILFWTRLSNASQLVAGFENPSSLQQGQAPTSSLGIPPVGAPSSTSSAQNLQQGASSSTGK